MMCGMSFLSGGQVLGSPRLVDLVDETDDGADRAQCGANLDESFHEDLGLCLHGFPII